MNATEVRILAAELVLDVAAAPELELPTQCAHCGARLPEEMGDWVLGVDLKGGPGWVCSQECACGQDFPP